MKRKQSGLSRHVEPEGKSGEQITPKSLTKAELLALESEQAQLDSSIDCSDIPKLTPSQLAELRRLPRDVVTARLDADVMDRLRSLRPGHSARINRILRAVMEKSR